LAAVGGVAAAGLEVGGAVDGGDAAVRVLVHAGAPDDVGAHQAHFAPDGQPLELGRRHLGKVVRLDPQLPAEHTAAGGAVAGFPVGVVGQAEVLRLAGGVVVHDQLDRAQHRHTALGGQVQLAADAGFQLAHINHVVRLGDARLPHE